MTKTINRWIVNVSVNGEKEIVLGLHHDIVDLPHLTTAGSRRLHLEMVHHPLQRRTRKNDPYSSVN